MPLLNWKNDLNQLGCLLTIAPVRESTGIKRPQTLTVKPDFLILRNQVTTQIFIQVFSFLQPRGPTPGSDRRNILIGLMTANIPAVNSLTSEYMNLERPIMWSSLREIKNRVGAEKFPLISQTYYSSHVQMVISPEYPAILKVNILIYLYHIYLHRLFFKVSHAHRGMGKMKVFDSDQFRDFSTVMGLHGDYLTAEKFIDADYGIRVQKIGNHYRVYKVGSKKILGKFL